MPTKKLLSKNRPSEAIVLSRTTFEGGDLEGWTREDRRTAGGRHYTRYLSPEGVQFDSRIAAMREVGAAPALAPHLPGGAVLFGRQSRQRINRGNELYETDEVGDHDYESGPYDARSAYPGNPPAPPVGSIPADDDLPGWRLTEDHCWHTDPRKRRRFINYIDPEGRKRGSRGAALEATGQLRVHRTDRETIRQAARLDLAHDERLKMPIRLPPSFVGVATQVEREGGVWAPDELPRMIERRFSIAACSERSRALRWDDDDGPALALAPASSSSPSSSSSPASTSRRVAVIDLFCGIGGLSLGLRSAGFEHTFGIDSEIRCIHTYRANACGAAAAELRVRPADVDRWVLAFRDANLCGDKAVAELVLAGAPPCQPYSSAGSKAGPSDDRDCLQTAVEIALRVRPLVLLLENVPNLMAPEFGDYVQPLLRALRVSGYVVRATVHRCERHSVPQQRCRLLLSALRLSEGFGPEARIVVPRSSAGRPPTARDALGDGDGDGENPLARLWTGPCPPDLRVQLTTIVGRCERLRKSNEATALVRSDAAAPTLMGTAITENSYNRLLALPIDVVPSEMTYGDVRALQRRHVLALQTFPQGFVMYGGMRFQGTCIGNAIPPMFAHDLGSGLVALLDACKGSTLLRSTRSSDVAACLVAFEEAAYAHIAP